MTARERVTAVLEGRRPDRTPVLFTMHFPPEMQEDRQIVDAHLRFFEESHSDIGKVMNENLLRGEITVHRPGELAGERISSATRRAIDAQVDLVKRIVDQNGGRRMILATLHGPMVSVHHMSGRKGLFVENLDFYRTCKEEAPQALRCALAYGAEVLSQLARRCVEEAGADGIYFAALGAERTLFSREEYAELVRPFDCQVLQAVKGVHVLHICKKDVDVTRFLDYPAQILNWEMTGGNLSLEEALTLVPASYTLLGGFSNEGGPLLSGSLEEIAGETHRLLKRVQRRRWILGAGCTLPTGTDMERLQAVAQASEAYGTGPEESNHFGHRGESS